MNEYNRNTILSEENIGEGQFMNLKRANLAGGGIYEFGSRKGGQNAVAGLIRNVENGTFVLIDQFRIPLQRRVLELVAGVIDKDGKTNEEVMREEVIEETGYKDIRNIEFLATTSASAGALSETTSVFDVEVTGKRGKQNLGEDEDINVHEFPYKDFNSFLKSKIKEGLIIDPKVCMAVYMTLSKTGNIIF